MSVKYVVIEVKPEANLDGFVNFAMEQHSNFAIMNRVSGLFEKPPAVVHSNRTNVFALKQEKRNDRNVSVWEEQEKNRSKPYDDSNYAEDPPMSLRKRTALLDTSSDGEELSKPSSSKRAKHLSKLLTGKTSTNSSRRNTDLTCNLCSIGLTENSRYQNTRMREHVQRHMNNFTVECGYCEYKGVLREHIRKHLSIRHVGQKLLINPIVLDAEYHERFSATWEVCFPDFPAATLPLGRDLRQIKEKEVLEEIAVSLNNDEYHDSNE